MAGLASAVVVVNWLFGSRQLADGVIVVLVLAWYFVGATIGGAIFGLLFPFRKSRAGSIVSGIAAALIPFLALAGLLYGMTDRNRPTAGQSIGAAVLCAVLLGGWYGFLRWQYDSE